MGALITPVRLYGTLYSTSRFCPAIFFWDKKRGPKPPVLFAVSKLVFQRDRVERSIAIVAGTPKDGNRAVLQPGDQVERQWFVDVHRDVPVGGRSAPRQEAQTSAATGHVGQARAAGDNGRRNPCGIIVSGVENAAPGPQIIGRKRGDVAVKADFEAVAEWTAKLEAGSDAVACRRAAKDDVGVAADGCSVGVLLLAVEGRHEGDCGDVVIDAAMFRDRHIVGLEVGIESNSRHGNAAVRTIRDGHAVGDRVADRFRQGECRAG